MVYIVHPHDARDLSAPVVGNPAMHHRQAPFTQPRHPNPLFRQLAAPEPQHLPTQEPSEPPWESPPASASCSLRTPLLLRSRRFAPRRPHSARDPVAAQGFPAVSGPAAATSWVEETPPLRAAAVRVGGSWPESRGTPDRSTLPPRSGGPNERLVSWAPQRTAPANGREVAGVPLRTSAAGEGSRHSLVRRPPLAPPSPPPGGPGPPRDPERRCQTSSEAREGGREGGREVSR